MIEEVAQTIFSTADTGADTRRAADTAHTSADTHPPADTADTGADTHRNLKFAWLPGLPGLLGQLTIYMEVCLTDSYV